MHQHLLPDDAKTFLRLMTELRPMPASVWLFGSRANGRVTPTSDTDLLVFGDREFLEGLRQLAPEQPHNLDILVVVDGDTIIYPWRPETGSLMSWEWHVSDPDSASYVGTKCIPDEDLDEDDLDAIRRMNDASGLDENSVDLCQFQIRNERALRVYPVDA